MRKTIRKLFGGCNWPHLLFCILIIIYLLDTLYFYLDDLRGYSLHMPGKPLLLYAFKWVCLLYMLYAINSIRKNPTFYWFALNLLSVQVLCQGIMEDVFFFFYSSSFDMIWLELLCVILLVYLNRRSFIVNYGIKRKKKYWFYILLIPLVITVILYFIVSEFIYPWMGGWWIMDSFHIKF